MFHTNRAPILHQDQQYLQIDQTELSLEPFTQEQVASKMVSQPMLHYVQTLHLSCTETNSLQTHRSKISYDTRHLGVPSCVSRLISKHLVCCMQTVHLSCIKISTISKQTEPGIHLIPFTQEYQQVRPKWFLRLSCIRHKMRTYLAPKLTLSPNGPKRDSI